MSSKIKPQEKDAILQSLSAGVVPRIGLQHIQVGRKDEVLAVISDLERIKNGGSAIRFVIGRYGSGKSFFLNLIRTVSLDRKFVVVQADITTERRLQGSGGKARALYSELMKNMATRSKPSGGAISSIVQRWVSDVDYSVRQTGGGNKEVAEKIHKQLEPLRDLVSGYDFGTVIAKYVEGFHDSNGSLMESCLRWLRAEYTTKTEAKQDLEVRTIIEDSNIYDYLKLFAQFVKMAGYTGLIVNIDEMVVLTHRLNNKLSRESNFEMILTILNDCLQGSVSGIGFIFAGTDDFLENSRRGLFSYEALERRLSGAGIVAEGLKDFSGPVIRLPQLTNEEIYVLLYNIRNVFALGDKSKYLVPDDALKAFLNHCHKTLGSEMFGTVGDIAKSFTKFLYLLKQNPQIKWESLLEKTPVEKTPEPDMTPIDDENEDLVSLKL